jgi:hypothetical protein
VTIEDEVLVEGEVDLRRVSRYSQVINNQILCLPTSKYDMAGGDARRLFSKSHHPG